MSEAISAQGTTLKVNLTNASPPVYVTIPEVRSIGGPSETSDEIDVTHLGSVGGRREYIQSFRDSEDCTVEMNYVPDDVDQADFLDLYESGTVVSARVTYPDAATATFDMFVKARSRPVAVGDAIVISATMRITGQVTFVG